MAGAATRLPTKSDRLRRNQQQIKDIYGLNRNRLSPQTIQNPAFGSAGAGGDSASAAQSTTLKTQGDTMIGPIAFFPVDVFIDSTTDPTNPSINIGSGAANPPDFSTYVLVSGSGTDDKLSTIFGAAFAGQLLKMQAIVDIEITDGISETFGNIVTNTDTSVFLPAGSITEFIFDITVSPNGNQGGWRLASTGNADTGEAAGAIIGLSTDQTGTFTGTTPITFDQTFVLGNQEKIIQTATDGVFQISDAVFNGSTHVAIEGVETGNGTEAIIVWQEADAEGGPWTTIAPPSARGGTLILGKPSFTTQPSANFALDLSGATKFVRVALLIQSGTVTAILDGATRATIETAGGDGSGGGGGGSTTLAGLTDVSINSPQVDEVLTYNGTLWVNQTSPSGGMATNLSNMVSPTVPTVPLSMNDQEINGVASLDFDGAAPFIEGLRTLNFLTAGVNISDFSLDGLDITVAANQRININGAAGIIAVFNELNSTQRVLDMQSNRIRNTDKYQFSPVSSADTAGTAEIYEDTGFGNLRYVSNNSHLFVQEGIPTLLSIGNFAGEGGLLQDVGLLNFNSITGTAGMANNGDFQLDGSDMKVLSGGVIRNMSDIGSGGGATNEISQGDSNVTVTDTGTGAVTITVDGTSLSSFTTGVGMVLEVPLSMVANNIVGTGSVTPNGNGIQDLGSNTTFWQEVYSSQYNVGLNSNVISGDSFGIDYTVSGSAAHNFVIGASQKMVINSSEIDFLDDVNLNGNDLRMNNGDITLVDFMSFNGSGSLMNGIDFMTFHDSGGFLNLSGSDIINAGTIQASGKVTTGEIEINGALNHDGSTLGFFGQAPTSRKNYTLLNGTESLLQVIGKLNELAGILGDSGSNYGLINV